MNPTLEPSLCLLVRDFVHLFAQNSSALSWFSNTHFQALAPNMKQVSEACHYLKVITQNFNVVYELGLEKWFSIKQNLSKC